jgi:signal transduction histidine kinase
MIIVTGVQYLRRGFDQERAPEMLDEIGKAADRMKAALSALVEVARARRDLVPIAPQRIETSELTESLRRRLRALVYGRDIRTTVMATREVPEAIEIDALVLDRILDNLLTNAAKYTERGSILVDLEGTPGFLVVKVSDTGRGIAPEALERVFVPSGSDPTTRKGGGFGVGLSVVVRLLEQIGGRLEVMSKADTGTTFWVVLPVHPPATAPESLRPPADAPSNVVKIRRVRP